MANISFMSIFLLVTLVNGLTNGYLPDLSNVPFMDYFNYDNTPTPKAEDPTEDSFGIKNEILNADDPIPVDELLQRIDEEKDTLYRTEDAKQVAETVKELRSSLLDNSVQYVKVLYDNTWHAVNLGIPGSSHRIRSAGKATNIFEWLEDFINVIWDFLCGFFSTNTTKKDDESKDKDKPNDDKSKTVQPLLKTSVNSENNKDNVTSETKKEPQTKPLSAENEASDKKFADDLESPKPPVPVPSPLRLNKSNSLKDDSEVKPEKGSTLNGSSQSLNTEGTPLTTSKVDDNKSHSSNGASEDVKPKDKEPDSVLHFEKNPCHQVSRTESETVQIKPLTSSISQTTVMHSNVHPALEHLTQMQAPGGSGEHKLMDVKAHGSSDTADGSHQVVLQKVDQQAELDPSVNPQQVASANVEAAIEKVIDPSKKEYLNKFKKIGEAPATSDTNKQIIAELDAFLKKDHVPTSERNAMYELLNMAKVNKHIDNVTWSRYFQEMNKKDERMAMFTESYIKGQIAKSKSTGG